MRADHLVVAFNACINARDLDGLSSLMSDDHKFIDAAGGIVAGKTSCREAWNGFFAAFPDYQNHFDDMRTTGDTVIVAGQSSCADARLAGPALWRARVADGSVVEWQVYPDTPGTRAALGIAS